MSDRGNPSPPRPRAASLNPNGFQPGPPSVARVHLPGFGAHSATKSQSKPTTSLEESRQRGSEPVCVLGRVTDGTGISSTRLPGARAQTYREWRHSCTGIPGTVPVAATGIRGTKGAANPRESLRFSAGNFVLSNRSRTTTTRGARIRRRGGEPDGGPWPTKS